MNYNHTRSLRKVKQALVIPAIAVAVMGSATPALAAQHTGHHAARPTRTTAHARSQDNHFHTDGRKVG
jgi:glycerol dehydrogenase-like iron-containing ADH family enzyme